MHRFTLLHGLPVGRQLTLDVAPPPAYRLRSVVPPASRPARRTVPAPAFRLVNVVPGPQSDAVVWPAWIGLSVSPDDPNRVAVWSAASGDDGALITQTYFSHDQGAAWSLVSVGKSPPLPDNPDRERMWVDPRRPEVAYRLQVARLAEAMRTVRVQRSLDGGRTWSPDLRLIPDVLGEALAISATGQVGLLYQQRIGLPPDEQVITHLETTDNGFATVRDRVLAATLRPRHGADAPLGSTCDLTGVGRQFLGVFTAANIPKATSFPLGVRYQRRADFKHHRLLDHSGSAVAASVDPFFFVQGP